MKGKDLLKKSRRINANIRCRETLFRIAEDIIERHDFVDVIRCKNCEYFKKPTYEGTTYCSHLSQMAAQYPDFISSYRNIEVSENDFCSFAKRKVDAE